METMTIVILLMIFGDLVLVWGEWQSLKQRKRKDERVAEMVRKVDANFAALAARTIRLPDQPMVIEYLGDDYGSGNGSC